MRILSCYKRIVEVSKEHPDLIPQIDEFLEQKREVPWIASRMNYELKRLGRPTFTKEELAGFLHHREKLERQEVRSRRLKGTRKARKGAAKPAVAAAPEPPAGEQSGDVQPGPDAYDKERSHLAPGTILERAREKRARTHEEIVEWAGEVVRDMFEVARADPESDAGSVMKVLAFHQIVANEEKMTEEMVTKLMEAYRRTDALEGEKMDWQIARKKAEADLKVSRGKAHNLELRNKQLEGTLDKVKDAMGRSRVLSPADIYDKISAVIGMGDTVVPRVEKTALPGL